MSLWSFGDTEIGQIRMTILREQDILRLHVTMHQPRIVRYVQRSGDLAEDVDRVLRRKPSLVHPLAQRRPLDETHCQIEPPFRLSRVVDRNNIWMIQRSRMFPFSPEPLPERFVAAQLRREHLQRNRTPKRHLLGTIDDGHPAKADDVDDPEATERLARRKDCRRSRHSSPLWPTPLAGRARTAGIIRGFEASTRWLSYGRLTSRQLARGDVSTATRS